MKQTTVIALSLLIAAMLMLTPAALWAEDAQVAPKSDAVAVEETVDSTQGENPAEVTDKIIAYYFHGTRRCASCRKIEAYSAEAVETGFADDLKGGTLEWHVVNIDEDANKHYIKEYQLYTKSVILSHVKDGKEIGWKNLDKVWTLLGDKEGFVNYVQTETRTFMNGDAD
jgi:hypothetical protein